MGVKIQNIVGRRFGRLVVQSVDSGNGQKTKYVCICDCGNTKIIRYKNLVLSGTESCGCLREERHALYRNKVKEEGKTHGGSRHPLYQSYKSMIARSTNPNNIGFESYGAAGRGVCDQWADPLTGFWQFVEDMGPKPDESYSIDRIDNNLGYFPENCRWASSATQQFNKNYTKRPGITRSENGLRWRAIIHFENVKYSLGTYDTYEEALAAREEAELRFHGEVWSGQVVVKQ